MPKVGNAKAVNLSEAEMMARMYEAVMGEDYKRPPGMSAREFVDRMPDQDQRADFFRAARAVIHYLVEVSDKIEPTEPALYLH
jgi:hypothetical protein